MGTGENIPQNPANSSQFRNISDWARALGGEVSGNSVSAPGPSHSAGDRSLSITPCATAPAGFLVHSFAGDDPIVCLNHVRSCLGDAATLHGKPVKGKDKSRQARGLWQMHEPLDMSSQESTPAAIYLRRRGYTGRIPPTLGYLPPRGENHPALIAAFGFCDEYEPGRINPPHVELITGVHLTRLTMKGDKAPIDAPKITIGSCVGQPIILAPANDSLAIDICEGIEKGLSIITATGAGMWVSGSASRIAAVAESLPSYVECVTIWADQDEAGLKGARQAALVIQAKNIEVIIRGIF
jgi:Toprim domain